MSIEEENNESHIIANNTHYMGIHRGWLNQKWIATSKDATYQCWGVVEDFEGGNFIFEFYPWTSSDPITLTYESREAAQTALLFFYNQLVNPRREEQIVWVK